MLCHLKILLLLNLRVFLLVYTFLKHVIMFKKSKNGEKNKSRGQYFDSKAKNLTIRN